MLYGFINSFIVAAENIIVVLMGAIAVMNRDGFTIGMLFAYSSYRGQFSDKAHGLVGKIIEYINGVTPSNEEVFTLAPFFKRFLIIAVSPFSISINNF